MNKERKGFDKSQQGKRVDNLPKTGHLTGLFEIDLYGCWWEVVENTNCKPFWIIGEYPSIKNKAPRQKTIRTLKVLERYYDPENPSSKHGEIRLRGKWLEAAGFSINSRVRVTINEGQIIIEKEPVLI
jgi:hypothetical protein